MLNVFRQTCPDLDQPASPEAYAYPTGVLSRARLATGRGAFRHLIERRPQHHPKVVLMPGYVAEGVVEPFRRSGYRILFYRLDENLSPDQAHVDSLLADAPNPAVFILIHYFGYPCGSKELSVLLRRRGALLVEDCAHALFSRTPKATPLSETADIALFSLNKFLPVTDGALITSRLPEVDLGLDEDSLAFPPETALAAYREHLEWGRRLSQCSPGDAEKMLAGLGASYENYYEVINGDLNIWRQSTASRDLERYYPARWLVEQRLARARIVHEALRPFPQVPVWRGLPPGTVPFCIPIRVPPQARERIVRTMMDQGYLLSTLSDKWDFIPPESRPSFSVETRFLDGHLLLPVSETLSESATAGMMTALCAQLGESA